MVWKPSWDAMTLPARGKASCLPGGHPAKLSANTDSVTPRRERLATGGCQLAADLGRVASGAGRVGGGSLTVGVRAQAVDACARRVGASTRRVGASVQV